jgi:hypothetical protein
MRVHSSTRYVALVALAGALACASNKARTDTGPDEAAAARDTTTGRDTTQNPPGYRGMERDTSLAPEHQQTPTDTFLQRQGQGAPQDTAGYSGMERVDTTGQRADTSRADTTGYNANPGAGRDTSGMSGMDTTGMHTDSTGVHTDSTGASSGAAGLDSTGLSKTGDTTGYKQSHDTTTAR